MAPDPSTALYSENNEFHLDTLQVMLSIPPINLHPMQTKSKSGIIKRKALLAFVQDFSGQGGGCWFDLSTIEPSTYKSSLKSPIWLKAMQEELDALQA